MLVCTSCCGSVTYAYAWFGVKELGCCLVLSPLRMLPSCLSGPSDWGMPAQGSSSVKEELVAIFRRVGERDPRGLIDLYAFQEVLPD